jgi:hypothetical protein
MSLSKDQERLVANELRMNPKFRAWFISRTRFAGLESEIVLIRDDWPWYKSPKTGVQSETDILAVFQPKNGLDRFALHIENKAMNDKFQPNQPELYFERGNDWVGVEKWGSYKEFTCVLTAPFAFLEKHFKIARKFDAFVSHESLVRQISEFANPPPYKPIAMSMKA